MFNLFTNIPDWHMIASSEPAYKCFNIKNYANGFICKICAFSMQLTSAIKTNFHVSKFEPCFLAYIIAFDAPNIVRPSEWTVHQLEREQRNNIVLPYNCTASNRSGAIFWYPLHNDPVILIILFCVSDNFRSDMVVLQLNVQCESCLCLIYSNNNNR